MYRKTFTYEGKRYDITAKTMKELNRKIAERKKLLKKQSSYVPTFKEWFETFVETYKSNLAERTIKSYRERGNKHYLPYFKNKKINDIKHINCQQFFNHLNGYGNNTIHKLYHDLHQIFDKAIVNGYITVNPVHGCILPDGSITTRRNITNEERRVILHVCTYHPSSLYILFMLYCGIRPHEASYIQGKDIIGKNLHMRGTKSVCADRIIPIPDVLYNILGDYSDDDYVITSAKGLYPIKEHHRTKMWNSFKREMSSYIDVAKDLTPYCLRHTYCTDLQDAGIPINVARYLMGHSNITLTSRIYTHQTEEMMVAVNDKINSHINSHKELYLSRSVI